MKIAFVCVANAGRSQMAAAFAEREVARRNLSDTIEITSGGTQPADTLHREVLEVMRDVGIDLSDRHPQAISREEIAESEVVVTMGCSAEDICPITWDGTALDWKLADPNGRDIDAVRAVRDEIEDRVAALFDGLKERQPLPDSS